MYSKKILNHFRNPKNQGILKNANAVGEEGSPSCGDVMKLYLKISKNKNSQDYIESARFETLGCAVAIAISSILTEKIKGKEISKILKITKDDLLKDTGEIPKSKIHCSMLGIEALQKAILNYSNKPKSS